MNVTSLELAARKNCKKKTTTASVKFRLDAIASCQIIIKIRFTQPQKRFCNQKLGINHGSRVLSLASSYLCVCSVLALFANHEC